MYGFLNFEFTVFSYNEATVTLLASHCGVKRSPVGDYGSPLTLRKGFCKLGFSSEHKHLCLFIKRIIAVKFRCDGWIHKIIDRGVSSGHFGREASAGSCRLLLLLHAGIKAFPVNGITFIRKYFLSKIIWKAISIVQLEGIYTGKHL